MLPFGEFGQPHFDPDWPQAMNLGGIGFIIGHELGHSLDRASIEFEEDGYYSPIEDKRFNRDYDAFVECLSGKYSKVSLPAKSRTHRNVLLGLPTSVPQRGCSMRERNSNGG